MKIDRQEIKKLTIERTAKKLKEFRTGRQMTQEQLAIASGVSVSTIQRIEQGKGDTTFDRIILIARALNVTLGNFFDDITNPPLTNPDK